MSEFTTLSDFHPATSHLLDCGKTLVGSDEPCDLDCINALYEVAVTLDAKVAATSALTEKVGALVERLDAPPVLVLPEPEDIEPTFAQALLNRVATDPLSSGGGVPMIPDHLMPGAPVPDEPVDPEGSQ